MAAKTSGSSVSARALWGQGDGRRACDHCGQALDGGSELRRDRLRPSIAYCSHACAFIVEQIDAALEQLRHPALTAILSVRDLSDPQLLRIAASLTEGTACTVARALAHAAQCAGAKLAPVCARREAGASGVEGTIEGRRYRLGRAEYALAQARCAEPVDALVRSLATPAEDGQAAWVLADEQGAVALMRFRPPAGR